jgi:hypothetical protein
MLWRRIRRTTASTGVNLTVTHSLRIPPDVWWIEPVSDRGVGRTYVRPGTALTNTINIACSISTTVTVDVFVVSLRNELY